MSRAEIKRLNSMVASGVDKRDPHDRGLTYRIIRDRVSNPYGDGESVVTFATAEHERLHAAAQPPMQSWRDAVRRNIEEIHTPFGSQPVGWKAAQPYAVY